jgi:hypothetical protein
LAGIAGIGADYRFLTFRELDILAKTADKQRWIMTATNAFYSNANINPKQPSEIIPRLYRQESVEMVSEEKFLADLRAYKKRNNRL